MNTKNDIKKDIYQQQSKIIESQRQQLKELSERVEYLEYESREFHELKDAFGGNGNITYNMAMQSIMTRRNAAIERQRQQENYEREAERNIAAANKQAEQEAAVLKEHPELAQRVEQGKLQLEKDKQSSYELVNRWFDMSEEDFSKYRSHKHTIHESPIQRIITVEEENAPGSTIRKVAYYSCDRCYDSSYLSLDLTEKHIFTEDHETHRDAVLSEVDKATSTELVKLNTEYKQDIQNYIESKARQEYDKQQKQQEIIEKHERDQLPFVRGDN